MSGQPRPGPTVSLAEARRQLFGAIAQLPVERVALDESLGLALAESVVAAESVPPFAGSAMDGFAVRAQDTDRSPVSLRLVGGVTAGSTTNFVLGAGMAMAIATGAPVPEGADAVCMVERTSVIGDEVTLEGSVRVGENIRYPGEDIASGSLVFESSVTIGPPHIGVLASIGVTDVSVYRRARVGVLSTGDELRALPGPLEPGQIHDSNRHALLTAARAAGCHPVDLGVIADDPAAIAECLVGAITRCDAIITSGGVSVGVADHMKPVLGELSAGNVHWMEIAIRPAKPFGFAVLADSGVPVLCMPGNPVSTLVSFELLARPALRSMMGHKVIDRVLCQATATEPLLRIPDGKTHFVRVIASSDLTGGLRVTTSGGQGSHQLSALARANALAVLPDGAGIGAGEEVNVLIIDADGLSRSEGFSL